MELHPFGAGPDQDLCPGSDFQNQTGHRLGVRGELGEAGLQDQGVCQLGEVLPRDGRSAIHATEIHHDSMRIGQNLHTRLGRHPGHAEEDFGTRTVGFHGCGNQDGLPHRGFKSG